MNKNESKYFSTAAKMDESFFKLLERKDFAYITVKEICEHACVNRSTFYLHYESIEDLLVESTDYFIEKFSEHMRKNGADFTESVCECRLEELYFITPQYLEPYLSFIKEYKRLFSTALKNSKALRLDKSYEKMFRHFFAPILERYGVLPSDRKYIMSFYINGIMAIISDWLLDDCVDSVEHIMHIITDCIMSKKHEHFAAEK